MDIKIKLSEIKHLLATKQLPKAFVELRELRDELERFPLRGEYLEILIELENEYTKSTWMEEPIHGLGISNFEDDGIYVFRTDTPLHGDNLEHNQELSIPEQDNQSELFLDLINTQEYPEQKSKQGYIFPVYFGTNRKPSSAEMFGNERSENIHYGKANILIPPGHRFGETGNSFLKRLIRFEFRDDHLKISSLEKLDEDAYFHELSINNKSSQLIIIHGYNTSFSEAAIRSAQIGFDLCFEGIVSFFSWPSIGSVKSYPVDEASIEASEKYLAEYLVKMCTRDGISETHVIAHSMGNRGLLRALNRIGANDAINSKVKFGQILLAAPDVDRSLFLDLAGIYPKVSTRTTLYASKRDLALAASNFIHQAPRAGYFEPYTIVDDIDTIAVPNFNVDILGHGYYAEADALLNDIGTLIRYNAEPDNRMRLYPASESGKKIWKFRR